MIVSTETEIGKDCTVARLQDIIGTGLMVVHLVANGTGIEATIKRVIKGKIKSTDKGIQTEALQTAMQISVTKIK